MRGSARPVSLHTLCSSMLLPVPSRPVDSVVRFHRAKLPGFAHMPEQEEVSARLRALHTASEVQFDSGMRAWQHDWLAVGSYSHKRYK